MLYNICTGKKDLLSKKKWSICIWEKAWLIEDLYWESTTMLNIDNDILVRAMMRAKYLTWWVLSDKFPNLINICEMMAKLVCHASKLKGDDVRLKGLTPSFRACTECDLFFERRSFSLSDAVSFN